MDDLLEDSATPQQIGEAVKRELSQVESMIKDQRSRPNVQRSPKPQSAA